MGKYDHLVGLELASGTWRWSSDTALLYAVGVGAGLGDPQDELQFTTENTPGVAQQVIPSFVTLMGIRSNWMEACGWVGDGQRIAGIVHGEQATTLVRPIPTAGEVRLSKVMRGVHDKGSGALVVMETMATLADTGEPLGSARMSVFVQGQGGFDDARVPAASPGWTRPARSPDVSLSFPVGLNQSLIYRLSGDHNLHGTHPPSARADGFGGPVLYGLGTYGFACRALVKGACDGDVDRFGHMEGRFSKPVYPGDRLDTHIWRTGDGALFQVLANGERVVLDRGVFHYRPARPPSDPAVTPA